MNNYEKIKSISPEELAEFLCTDCDPGDGALWHRDFNEKYCKNCEYIVGKVGERDAKFSFCELMGHCRFFPQYHGIIPDKEAIALWLKQETRTTQHNNTCK